MKLVNKFINVWLVFSISYTLFAYATDFSIMALMKGSGYGINTALFWKITIAHFTGLLKDITMILLLKFVLIRFVKNDSK